MRLGWWRRSGDVRLAEDKLPARPKLQAGPSPNLGAWWNQPAASEKEAHQAHYHLYWKGGQLYHQTHRIIYHPYQEGGQLYKEGFQAHRTQSHLHQEGGPLDQMTKETHH